MKKEEFDSISKSKLSCLLALFKSVDVFAKPISLSFGKKHETSFKTVIGGVTSIILISIFGVYTCYSLIQMANRTKVSTSKNEIYTDLYYQTEPNYVAQHGKIGYNLF